MSRRNRREAERARSRSSGPAAPAAPPQPKASPGQITWALAGVFAVALAVRLFHIWQIRSAPFFSLLIGDAKSYDAWAQRIAAGDWIGREVFYQAPLYPYFLGATYVLLGRDLVLVRILQVLLGAGTCAVLAAAVRQWFGERAGRAAGLILALYAPAIFFDALLQKTVLDAFFLAWLLLALALFDRRTAAGPALLAGIALGCLILTRENALVFLPLVLVWMTVRGRRAPVPLLAFLLGATTVLAPVALRNRAVGGELHLTTSQLGPNLYIGNSAEATGTYVPLRSGRGDAAHERQDATELAEAALGRSLSPSEVSGYWRKRALEWISSHPGRWLALTAKKLMLVCNAREAVDTEDLDTQAGWSAPLRIGSLLLHFGVLAPLGFLGMWLTRERWRELWLLYAMGAIYAGSVVLFYVLARYRYPLVLLLIPFAGAGLVELPAWWRRSGASERWRGTALFAAALLLCNWPLLSAATMRSTAHYNIGRSLQEEGRTDAATAEYRLALELWPGHAGAHSNLGVLLAARGEHEEALEHYLEAVRLEPGLATARASLGIELASRGRLREAVECFEIALRLAPRDATVLYDLGLALASVGEKDRAIATLGEALRIRPAYADAHNNLGVLLSMAGRFDEAIEHFRAALRLNPGSRETAANLERARALAQGGR